LRALQEKEFRRFGGSQTIRFQCRMIAATDP
jgi:transcriptional regulator with GAF, ATPase, and Fis domain